jgi:hypothetical protein
MNDFKMGKSVRSLLSRLRLDTQHVTVRFERGILSIGGRFQYMYGVDGHRPDLTFEILHEIDRSFRRLDGVSKVEYTLDNWTHNSDGHWTKKQIRELTGPARSMAGRLRAARPTRADQI